MANKIILGLVGEMGAGKTTLTNYLKERYGAVSFRFSTMLRDVLQRLHIPEERATLQKLSTLLRQEFGDDLMSKVIAGDAKNSPEQFIITEGIRRPTDMTYLAELPGFHLVALTAESRTRFERITARGENPDDRTKTWKTFQNEARQEAEQEVSGLIQRAELLIDNNGSIENLYLQADALMQKLNA